MATSTTGLILAAPGRWARRAAMIAVLAAGAVTSYAQTAISWSATVNGLWGTGTNWTGGSVPANSLTTNYASFNNATGVTVTAATTQSVAGLDFGSSSGSYIITNPSGGGKTLTLGAYGINSSSANNQTISGASLTLKLGAASTFTVGGNGSLTLDSTLAGLNNNNLGLTLRGTGSGTGTIAAAITGNGSLTKLDSGSWTLSSASNTYAGGTIIGSSNGASGGTLVMGANNVLGAGALTIYAGTLNTGSSGFTDTITSVTLGGGASGTTATVTGNATITLGGNVTYDATNNANGATIAANLALGGANRTFTIGDSTAAATDLAISGVISGTRNIIKSGTGTLSLSGANTFTGTTTISQGTIQIDANAPSGANGALGNASTAVTLNDASTGSNNTALLIGTSGVSVGRAITVANLGTGTTSLGGNMASGTGTFTGNVVMNKATTFNADGTSNITFNTGVVSGTGNLTKTGTGTITLAGANTYTGKTSIQDGTLSVASLNNVTGGTASSNLGAPTTVANGTIDLGNLTTTGTLQYTGTGQTTDRVINLAGSTGGGTIDSSGSGTLTFSSNLTAAAGSKTLTLTGSNTTAAVFAGNIVNSSGTVAVAKSGAGTWTLSGTNTYSGGTTLNTGTLNINSTTALGTGTFTIAGGTIDNTTGSAITLSNNNAQAWNGDFAFTGTKDLNLGTGAVTLGATRTVTTTAGNLTVGGAISGASFGLTKAGAGSLLLTNANSSYTGATTINAGTLAASTLANGNANSSIGASSNAAGNLVLNGGTLQYTGNSATTDRLFSVGTSGGTLDVSTSGQTLTLSNTGALGFNSQTGARTLTLTGAGNGSLASVIGDNSGATALTKTGAGTWTLTGTNTQTGTTTVSAGNLTVSGASAQLSGSTAALVVNGGTLNLNNTAQTVASLTGSGGTVNLGSGNTLTVNTSGTDTFSGALAGSGTFTKSGTGTNSQTLSGDSSAFTGTVNVSQGTLIAAGNLGTTSLTGTNTVSSGAALGLSGGITVGNNSAAFSIAGDGVSNSGAIYNSAGSNSLNGSVTLANAARIGSAGGTLTLGSTRPSFTPSGHTQPTENGYITLGNATSGSNLTFSGAGNITVNDSIRDYSGQIAGAQWSGTSQISGPVAPSGTAGSVTIDMGSGSSTVTFAANANSYTGTTFVKNGTLILNTTNNSVAPHSNSTDSFHSINGPLVIGNGSTSATVKINSLFGPNETMAIGTAVTLYNDGTLDLNRASQTIGSLTFTSGGTVLTGTGGHLYLNGDVAFNSTANGQTAQIGSSANDGYLSLELNLTSGVDAGGGASRTFTINPVNGSSTANLNVYSTVVSGSVVKAGTGTLTFFGNNTYTGTTSVNAGIFNAQAGTSGGYSAFGSGDGTDASGTTVASGATVQVQGGITVTNEKLNLNGNGFNGTYGALQNVSGNNTWGTTTGFGSINLVTDARINSDSGTLTIPTIMTSTGNNKTLTVGGAGDTTISGQINTGGTSAGLIKDGAGTLTLSGNNGYQGATTINAGVVVAANAGALGTTTTGTTVNGGALHLSGGITIGSEALTLNGTGNSGNGALRNVSGTNTFGGTITAATSTRIQNDVAGNSLALTGGLVTSGSSGIDLNFGGTGNTTVSGNNGSGYTVNNGSSTLTKDGTGTLAFSLTGTSTQNQVGATSLNGGTIKVASGTLNTGAIDSVAGTTLAIASGAQVTADYASGTTIFSGVISDVAGDGGGIFQKNGAGTLVFGSSFNAGTSSTLILNGGTLKLGNTSGVSVTFDTIHITANTTIDFNASYATTLSSAKLNIDAGVQVSVINWVSLSDVWYATSTINNNTGSIMDLLNQSPLNQITFAGNSNMATTWVTTQGGQYFNHEIRPTPEPSTYGAILLGASLALLGWRRYRRPSTAKAEAPLARGTVVLKT